MKFHLLKAVILAAALSILLFAPSHSQESTPVFVVYGYVLDDNYIPFEDNSLVLVTNLTTGQSVQTEIGEGADSGKYCAVFVDYQSSCAASVGDLLQIAVKEQGMEDLIIYREYTVTILDIANGSVFLEDIVNLEESSWGAIKSLYR